MKRKHVTLLIISDQSAAQNPGGYGCSRFCELYRAFETKLSPTMRQTHAAGEQLFVDYAGEGVPVLIDRLTGEIRKAQISSPVLGASSFTFAWASWNADASRSGSTPTCMLSRRWAAIRICSCRTICRTGVVKGLLL